VASAAPILSSNSIIPDEESGEAASGFLENAASVSANVAS